jgi:ribosomal protein S18 acetylase RimI-like enzyme
MYIDLSWLQNGGILADPTHVKADLIPFTAEYSQLVRSWLDSPDTLHDVTRGKEFPPADDIVDSWQRDGVTSYLLSADRSPVAYGELWARKLERAVEIAHLVVDNGKRSRGYGTKMLELLYDRAASRPDVTKVLINLYTENTEALGCFLKARFEIIGTSQHTQGLQMIRTVHPSRK